MTENSKSLQEREASAREHPDSMSESEYRVARMVAQRMLFRHAVAQESYWAIVTGGQPGAGKTHLINLLEQQSSPGGFVLIDIDALREMHPRYASHAEADFETAATRVHHDASKLGADIRQIAMDGRYNLVVDKMLDHPERSAKTISELKSAGYEVCVCAMAVSLPVSTLGVYWRLERALGDSTRLLIPRTVERYVQVEAYNGLPKTIRYLEDQNLADKFLVFVRERVAPVYHSSEPVDGQQQTACDAVIAERMRPWAAQELVDHAKRWDIVYAMAQQRKASGGTLETYYRHRSEAHWAMRQCDDASQLYDQSAESLKVPESWTLAATAATCRRGSSLDDWGWFLRADLSNSERLAVLQP